jgi:putative PIN family toxin of toxin-antitoxin system
MKVVIDTNILVSAAWRDKSPEAVVLWIAFREDWEWVVSEEILEEYREVLGREKFDLSDEVIEKWEYIVTNLTSLIEITAQVDFPRDRKDSMILACALSANVDYLITGDKDFNEAYKVGVTNVISVADFKRLIIDHWQ